MKGFLMDLAIVAVVLLIALPFAIKSCAPKVEEIIQHDTIYVYDTIRIVEPTPTGEDVVRCDTAAFPIVKELESIGKLPASKNVPDIEVLGTQEDVYVSEKDDSGTLTASYEQVNSLGKVSDSAKVVIPITERTYEDSTYKAVVRGYNPELVSLDIYGTTKYYPVVEKVKMKPKITISAGVYGGFGSKGADYGLGVMVGVPIWSW